MTLKDNELRTAFINALRNAMYVAHQNSVEHGFYENEFNLGEKFMLMVTELAEGFEGHRKNIAHLPDEHCPEYTNLEVEVADTMIRIFDFAEYKKLKLAGAILAKMDYNATRPYKHGKQY